MAFWASSGVLIVTKPNPRGRPVARSIMRLASTTVPCAANASCRSFSVMLKERFPTNSLALIYLYCLRLTFAVSELFPTAGFQIHTELVFTCDLPCSEGLSIYRRGEIDRFSQNSKTQIRKWGWGYSPILMEFARASHFKARPYLTHLS